MVKEPELDPSCTGLVTQLVSDFLGFGVDFWLGCDLLSSG